MAADDDGRIAESDKRGRRSAWVCLYPFVDVPDWWTQKWAKIGIYDVADKESFERLPCDAYIEELRRWQKTLDQPENVEPDGYRHQWGRVQLSEVRRYAAQWEHDMPPQDGENDPGRAEKADAP